MSDLDAGAAKVSEGAASLSANYGTFDSQIQALPETMQNTMAEQMKDLKTAIDTLTTEYTKLDTGIGAYTNCVDDIQKAYSQFYAAYSQVVDAADTLTVGSAQVASGSNSLSAGSKKLSAGTKSLQDGSSSLAQGMTKLQSGSGSLVSGAGNMRDGLAELLEETYSLKSGTEEFGSRTSDIDDQIDDAIDEVTDKISGSDYEAISFTSDKNTDIGLVQFAMKTEAIEKSEPEKETVTEEKKSIMQKLKDLF